jgi:hypothetical protein
MSSKAQDYKWAKPGDNGIQQMVPIGELNVDMTYQRCEVSHANTLAIAKDFDWVAFGNVIVMKRADGKLYVIDGQQRTLAAKLRGDIEKVPCVIFESNGVEHEARGFIATNTRRRSVSAITKFHARVLAKESPDTEIQDWLDSIGFRVSADNTSNCIAFPTRFIETWKASKETAKKAFHIQCDIIGPGESVNSEIHCGICYLLSKDVEVRRYVDKMKSMGGKPAVLRAINTAKIELSRSGDKTYGLGILTMINYKLKNKIDAAV